MADFSSITDCATRIGIDPQGADAGLLKGFMAAATAMMLDYLNRDPRLNTYTETVHGQGLSVIALRNYPIFSVDELSIDGNAVAVDQLVVDEFTVSRKSGVFPRGRGNVQVTYTAGIDPTPRTLREAHIMAVAALWIAKDVNPNATGEGWGGVSSEQWQAEGPGYLPAACRMMIRTMVRPGVVS